MTPLRFTAAKITCRFLPPIVSQTLRNLIFPIKSARRKDFTFISRSQTGSMLSHSISDSQAYRFSIHGYHEWRNLAIAIALCRQGDTIVEIGAHIGTETIGFSDIVGSSGKVHAFEPLPANLESLKNTVNNSQYRNTIISPIAVGDKLGKVRFVTPLPKESSGLSHIVGKDEKPIANTIEVDCVTVDSLANSIGQSKVIFIDAEGSDLSILQGGKNYISNYKPAIVLECYPSWLERAGFNVSDLFSTIRNMGYRVFEISRFGLKPIRSVDNYNKVSNWLCIHSSKLEDARIVDRNIKLCGIMPCIPGINPISRKPIYANGFINNPSHS